MIRHLVLCGLGPGHLRLLEHLTRQAGHIRSDIGISLLTRQHRYIRDSTLRQTIASATNDKMAARLAREAAAQSERLELMVQKTGIRWIDNTASGLDPATRTLQLDDGRTLRFDWLSIEPEPEQDRELIDQTLPGARANGLFMRPYEAFCKLWPQVQALAATRPLRFTVVLDNSQIDSVADEDTDTGAGTGTGAGAGVAKPFAPEKPALELAFALRHAFKSSAVTVITGGAEVGAGLNPQLQLTLQKALQKRHINVLRDAACAIEPGEILLRSGARLACDVPLLACRQAGPEWLLQSGLTLNPQGGIETDQDLRSTSHPVIYVHSPVDTAQAGRLYTSLRRMINGQPVAANAPARTEPGHPNRLYRLDCADGYVLLAWRNWAIESRHLWGRRS